MFSTQQKRENKPTAKPVFFQPRLTVNQPNDVYEQEADHVADKVMRMPESAVNQDIFFKPAVNHVQRKCQACEEEDKHIHRKENSNGEVLGSNELQNYVGSLNSSGQAIPDNSRKFFESRFGRDFSNVKIHTDTVAAKSAQSINALAYTTGNNIVFNSGQYAPESDTGKRLMAHELTHVLQQSSSQTNLQKSDKQNSAAVQNFSNSNVIARAGNRAPAPTGVPGVMATGNVRTSGIQFFPLQITSTKIGPVSGEGGLIHDDSGNRLSVIVGQGMSLRRIAGLILNLWNSATPFTPDGSTTPLITPPVTADILARALMVYNQYYLQITNPPPPTLEKWKGGLRFPLPVEIDQSNVGVINKDQVNSLAGAFVQAWEPLLDQSGAANIVSSAADLQTSVSAFLTATTDTMARGITLSTKAITNPVESSPFINETFRQLAGSGFDVALAFMDSSVNSQIALLASQSAGAIILATIRSALATAPASLSTAQRNSLTRANTMLGLVTTAVARPMPMAQPNTMSPAGIQMVKKFEHLCSNLYDDGGPVICGRGAGHCTVGYGHLGICNGIDGSEKPFLSGITEPDAEKLLAADMDKSVQRVNHAITAPINQQQFDALVSFDFNTKSLGNLQTDVNASRFARIPEIMNEFTHDTTGAKLDGLVNRRRQEGALFSQGVYP
jgi:GH24 family phage-related lysozyme (muramidase)